MALLPKESRIILALQALKKCENPQLETIAKIYDIPPSTLRDRRAGRPARRDTKPNSRKLTDLKEEELVKYVLELDSRTFPPRPSTVADMANHLLAKRALCVGKNWVANFVKRCPELQMRSIRKYNYQRAKCEDPALIRPWFDLIRNTVAKYSIVEDDMYNFDETGFLMGMIGSVLVITTSKGRGRAKL